MFPKTRLRSHSQYGALALCDKHYGIMHTLSLDENIQTRLLPEKRRHTIKLYRGSRDVNSVAVVTR